MEFINSFFNFFTDKTRGLSSKAMISIAVVMLIIAIDNTLSFSYYYNTENKIEQITNLNEILSDSTLSKHDKNELLKLRKEIISRKTWKDWIWDSVSNIDFSQEGESFENPSIIDEDDIEKNERSYLWHFISSTWIILLVMLVVPFVGFFDGKTPFWQALGILLLIEPMFYGLAWLFAKSFSFIPIIFNNPIYNYILNAILCSVVVILLGALNKKK